MRVTTSLVIFVKTDINTYADTTHTDARITHMHMRIITTYTYTRASHERTPASYTQTHKHTDAHSHATQTHAHLRAHTHTRTRSHKDLPRHKCSSITWPYRTRFRSIINSFYILTVLTSTLYRSCWVPTPDRHIHNHQTPRSNLASL